MEELPDPTVLRMSQFLTTEHFTLQGARNGTIAEANGRLGHYLSIVGSGVVALAFVANVSKGGTVFLGFSAVVFPIMIILGVVTFIRTIQIGVNDFLLAQAINRIRHFYVEAAPEAVAYLSYPYFDDPDHVHRSMMPFRSPVQDLASTPGPIVLINSVLAGSFAGILASGAFSMSLLPTMALSLAAVVVTFVLHRIYGGRVWRRETQEHVETRFPFSHG